MDYTPCPARSNPRMVFQGLGVEHGITNKEASIIAENRYGESDGRMCRRDMGEISRFPKANTYLLAIRYPSFQERNEI